VTSVVSSLCPALAIVVAGCGRLGFATREDMAVDAPSDTSDASDASPDGPPVVGPSFAQRALAFTLDVNAIVTLPDPVGSGNALVVFTLSQQQPVMSIADSRGNTWQVARQVEQAMTGSKVNAWFVCGAVGGPDTITVTASFNNGPIHIAAYEVAGAAQSACVDQLGQRIEDTATTNHVVATDAATTGDQIVVAGFGAWFSEVQYTPVAGDFVVVSARPDPMGDSLGTVVSARMAGPQTVSVTADRAALYTALVLTIR